MNVIKHVSVTIQFDMWEPFTRESTRELDDLLAQLRTRMLLDHCGNVKTTVVEGDGKNG